MKNFQTKVRSITASLLSTNWSKEGAGGATITIAMIDYSSRKLKTANLGDSGAIVIRNSKIVFRTKVQQVVFNAPDHLTLGSANGVDKREN